MQIQILPGGGESTLFKQFFCDWKAKYDTTGPGEAYTIGSIAVVEQIPFDATALHNNQAMAAQHNMVDDGSGEVKVGPMERSHASLWRPTVVAFSTVYIGVQLGGLFRGYFLPVRSPRSTRS